MATKRLLKLQDQDKRRKLRLREYRKWLTKKFGSRVKEGDTLVFPASWSGANTYTVTVSDIDCDFYGTPILRVMYKANKRPVYEIRYKKDLAHATKEI
jgi:hypothetical protein